MAEENNSLTGFFNDGLKRIDIVLVFKDDVIATVKQMRNTFLKNITRCGLELEFEQGRMPEHYHLIFVKIHAPDAVITEFGLYFNERSFFKDSHLEFVNPIVNICGVSNERELIKIARTQYPGPDNYSTLERSLTVYKILLQMPFGKFKNHYGINKLIDKDIIQDAFALHDGPYFIFPKQNLAYMNARQVLFFEWLGMVNVWKMQPIHMIHEYFGKRISYYFAFYEYFNYMLIIPAICGVFTTVYLYNDMHDNRSYSSLLYPCTRNIAEFICPECRNYVLCPLIKESDYCKELKLLASIDKEFTHKFGYFIVFWGMFFLVPWRYRERYLSWIWEETTKYTNQLVRTEYSAFGIETKEITGKNINSIMNPWCLGITLLRWIIYVFTAACLAFWAFLLFRFSLIIWHYPRWSRYYSKEKVYISKYMEFENIAVGAAMYIVIVWPIKKVFMELAQKLTDFENNKTFVNYERSIALKMYTFSFIGTFLILITYTYLGRKYLERIHDLQLAYHSLYGFEMMNSGLGTTFDDICITLCVITIFEHVIFRLPGFLMKGISDYPLGFNSRDPCWEREFKLKTISEFFFHKQYNALAMQFALLTCYSMMFPVASILIIIMNIWDLRLVARQLLLEYRRPLLINTSGPGFWKNLILITALLAPITEAAIVIFQSRTFEREHYCINQEFFSISWWYKPEFYRNFTKISVKEYTKMKTNFTKYYRFPKDCVRRLFYYDLRKTMQNEMEIRYLLFATFIGFAIYFILFYVFPETSDSLEISIKKEQRIKKKYLTQWSLTK